MASRHPLWTRGLLPFLNRFAESTFTLDYISSRQALHCNALAGMRLGQSKYHQLKGMAALHQLSAELLLV